MNVEQCYEELGSDYKNVLNRFGQSEAMVKKFALRFLQDPSFEELEKNLQQANAEEAFRAAHTLKGSREITEICKPQFETCKKEYEHVVSCVQQIN